MKGNLPVKISISFLLITLISLPLSAQDRFTGWKKTQTEHFVFIFEEHNREYVEEIIGFSDEVYDDLTRFLDSFPKKIRCVVSGRIDTANGYFSSFPAHMNLFLTAPTIPWLGAKHTSWLKVLFIHELTHYIHLTYKQGFFDVLSYLFGAEIRPADTIFLPGWMIEGITVVNETIFSEGGRGRNPFFEMVYKAHIMENDFFSLRQASYSSPYPPRGRIYVAGYLLVDYMMERFGKDVFTEIHKKFVAFPFIGPRLAIKKTTGFTALEIFNDMKNNLRQKYKDDSEIPDGFRITPDVIGNYYSPRMTGRGLYLYRNTLDKQPAIVSYDPETKEEQVLVETSLTDYTAFSVTNDGEEILFSAGKSTDQHPAGYTYTSRIYRWRAETGKIAEITPEGGFWQPALSPDGSAAVAVEGKGPYSRLVQIDLDTGAAKTVFEKPRTTLFNPQFSPDGNRICFTLHDRGSQHIWILDRTLNKAFQVTGTDERRDSHFFPRFIDNDTVLFTSGSEGGLSLSTLSLHGNGEAPSDENSGEKRSVSVVCRDPIGAFDGIVTGGADRRIIYSSYSPDGYILKQKPFSLTESWPLSSREPDATDIEGKEGQHRQGHHQEDEPGENPQLSPDQIKPYIDFPAPLFWLPLPFYVNTISSPGPVFGLGAYVYGASVLSNAEWQAAVTTRLDIFQLGADVSASIRVYPFDLTYALSQAYIPIQDSTNYQTTYQSLGISLPIFSYSLFSAKHELGLETGLQHRFRFMDNEPFPIFGLGTDREFDTDNLLYLYGGVFFETRKHKAPRDLHYPLLFEIELDGALPLPVGSITREGFTLEGDMAAHLPSFFDHQVIKLGLKADYTTPELLESTTPVNSTVPRGMFSPDLKQYEGRVLASIDYLFTFALLDAPLPLGYNMFGINIQRFGGGFHFETLADWGVADPEFIVDDYFYVGFELNAEVGVSLGSIPVGTGLSFRFDRTFQEAPVLTRDFAFYFFIGTDSFQSAVSNEHLYRDRY
jgi:hypothetical protein